ncbi:MAG: bifunctional diguanylate cyclase/phosphodiesterase, partial [Nitrosomonas sp.]|nr:bifunctional diguanylate cyclase/phosphodiesterase [Nitrosomonas sp.]
QIEHLLLSWVMAADYEKKQLGLFFLGLDKFKNVNSTIGHELADNTLKLVADRLKTLESDHLVVTRFSGDKFVVLAKQLDGIDDANMVANQLKSLFTEPFLIDQHEFFITTSIGITLYPQMHSDKKQLVKDAESAMFQAKSLGRNRHEYYREEIGKNFSRKLNLETYLHKALDNNEFEVYYQPQISVLNRRIVGMEALIRWNHPKLGLVSPNDFIPIAEETGMIVPIGSWVMETAARQTALWCKKGYGLLRVGVNLSAKQFQDKDLAKEVIDVIEKTGIMPPSLDLEITESSVMSDISRTISVLHQINEIGVQISMDDFGTGYSSLSYLQQMPLHTLKIDRAFIKDIQPDGTNGEISKVIIAMCHTLGLNVIAEGVETEEQMQFLKMHECNEAQGYFISRPVPAIEMEKLLCANTNPTKKNKMEDLIF